MKQLKIQPHFWEGLTQFNRLPSFHGLSFIPCFFRDVCTTFKPLQFFWHFSKKKVPRSFFPLQKKGTPSVVGSCRQPGCFFHAVGLHRSKKKRRRHKSSRRGSILKWSGDLTPMMGTIPGSHTLGGSWEHHRTQQKCL